MRGGRGPQADCIATDEREPSHHSLGEATGRSSQPSLYCNDRAVVSAREYVLSGPRPTKSRSRRYNEYPTRGFNLYDVGKSPGVEVVVHRQRVSPLTSPSQLV